MVNVGVPKPLDGCASTLSFIRLLSFPEPENLAIPFRFKSVFKYPVDENVTEPKPLAGSDKM
jgi:hypothetical protein